MVSSGFRELIEPVLAREGVGGLPLVSNSVEPDPAGWRVRFHDEAVCATCGEACKLATVRGARERRRGRLHRRRLLRPLRRRARRPASSPGAGSRASWTSAASRTSPSRTSSTSLGPWTARVPDDSTLEPLAGLDAPPAATGSSSTPRRCASSATASSTCSWSGRRAWTKSRAWRGASRAEMESRLREPPPERPDRLRGDPATARGGRPPVHRPARPPALLRLRPELSDLAGDPRRLPRERRRTSSRAPGSSRRGRARSSSSSSTGSGSGSATAARRPASSSRAARSRT